MKATKAMISPAVDALCVGGLSLIVLPLLTIFGAQPLKGHDYGTLFALGLVLNWPHFTASYRLLYASGESIRRYRAQSIYFPLALLAYALFAIWIAPREGRFGNMLLLVAGLYLARHYTGQAWGMMASFAYASGLAFDERERRILRASLNLFMAWHLVWALNQSIGMVLPDAVPACAELYRRAVWIGVLASAVGAIGLAMVTLRTRQIPPVRVLIPWLAINVWYLTLAKDPSALLAVQAAHALQYLVFPLRVQMNRAARADWRPALISWAGWTLAGVALFEGIGPLAAAAFSIGGGEGPLPNVAASILISAIGIHHYFIDGALYKLRNPEVRRDLFAHFGAPVYQSTAR